MVNKYKKIKEKFDFVLRSVFLFLKKEKTLDFFR